MTTRSVELYELEGIRSELAHEVCSTAAISIETTWCVVLNETQALEEGCPSQHVSQSGGRYATVVEDETGQI